MKRENGTMSYPTRPAPRHAAHSPQEHLARGLGVFSIVLGAIEIAAPRMLCKWLGMEGNETLVRAYGAREVAAGVALLMTHDTTPWMYARVAGDVMDLATLTTGLKDDNERHDNVGIALGVVIGVTALDAIVAGSLSAEQRLPSKPLVDYGDRSGFPKSPSAMKGAARDLAIPADFRTPELLRPWPAS